MNRFAPALFSCLLLLACHSSRPTVTDVSTTSSTQEKFWQSLQTLCGKAYQGTVVAAPATDTTFKGKKLIMHVRSCDSGLIRIPFFAGENRSRTW
ncbi:MAG: hypothetical protein JNM19_07070, partial [Chitinophagaceae bacterium]|nr:hypothetical protein [Chitinophagaceae bacterium]